MHRTLTWPPSPPSLQNTLARSICHESQCRWPTGDWQICLAYSVGGQNTGSWGTEYLGHRYLGLVPSILLIANSDLSERPQWCRVPTEQTHQGLLHLYLIRLIHASRAREWPSLWVHWCTGFGPAPWKGSIRNFQPCDMVQGMLQLWFIFLSSWVGSVSTNLHFLHWVFHTSNILQQVVNEGSTKLSCVLSKAKPEAYSTFWLRAWHQVQIPFHGAENCAPGMADQQHNT